MNKSLTLWVVVALVAAVLLGRFAPVVAVRMEPLGVWFVNIIKFFIPFIIFLTITTGIAGMSDLRKVGRIGVKSLIYFEVVTTFSLAIGIGMAYLIKPGLIDKRGLPIQNASRYIQQGEKGIDWIRFFTTNSTLIVLVLAIIAGIVFNLVRQRERILRWLKWASKYVFLALTFVMFLAPVGAFGGMAFTIGKYGMQTLIPLAKLMLTVYATCILFVLIVLGLILRAFGMNVLSYLKSIKEEILIVLGTSSSESALPSLMVRLENMGCSQPVVGLVVPTGYSFNLDGTSIYLSMSVIFIAQLYNVQLSLSELLAILGILMLTSKGAAGVTGSGFTVLAATLTSLHKIPVEGLAFLLAVDKFMSEARAITNIIGNGVATLVIAKSEGEFGEVARPELAVKI